MVNAENNPSVPHLNDNVKNKHETKSDEINSVIKETIQKNREIIKKNRDFLQKDH